MTEQRRKRIPIERNGEQQSPSREEPEAGAPEARTDPAEAEATAPRGDGPAGGETPAAEDTETPAGAPEEGRAAGSPGPNEGADERISALEGERDGYLEDLRRLKAEFENYRRRSQRELTEARSRARAAMIVEFLPILDNLDRALAAASEHEEAKLVDGVRMTHRAFLDLLKREGVEPVNPLGDHFDPELHEAMFAQDSDEPEGTVVYVMEPGYRMGERLLRPAKVAVSTGSAEGAEG